MERFPYQETIRFQHKGVLVFVHIDYHKGKISLVDHEGKPMKYCFAERDIEYMNGWRIVLQAMDLAIQEAYRELALYQKRMEEDKEALVIRSLLEIGKQEL